MNNFKTYFITGCHSEKSGGGRVRERIAVELGGETQPETLLLMYLGQREFDHIQTEGTIQEVFAGFDPTYDDRKVITADGRVWIIRRVRNDYFVMYHGTTPRGMNKAGEVLSEIELHSLTNDDPDFVLNRAERFTNKTPE